MSKKKKMNQSTSLGDPIEFDKKLVEALYSPDKKAITKYMESRENDAKKIISDTEARRAQPSAKRILDKAEITIKHGDKERTGEEEYTNKVIDSGVTSYSNRMLLATPTIGIIRMEWAAARYGMAIPSNFSKVDMQQYMSSYIPIRYTVSDAQNMIVNEAVTKGFEWLVLIEDDTIPPPDALIRFNEYIRDRTYPVVSGLYFTRSDPADPMVYRGRGNSFYKDWKLGDKVMVDGVPTGMLLLNVGLLKLLWNDAPEYNCGGYLIRRVFDTPVKTWFNEETGAQETLTGTSDLDFCTSVIKGNYLAKAGWPELQAEKYPFLIDTNIYCKHIDRSSGAQYPLEFPQQFMPQE